MTKEDIEQILSYNEDLIARSTSSDKGKLLQEKIEALKEISKKTTELISKL